MLAVIGAIALTILALYIILGFGQFALFCFLGFDEVNIPMGLVLLIPVALACIGWWVLVGCHININLN